MARAATFVGSASALLATVLVQPSTAGSLVAPPAGPTIAAGINHSVVIAPDGKPYAVGNDSEGATAQGGPADVAGLSAMQGLPGAVKAVSVAAGFETTLVLGSDGVPYATGYQNVGELAVGGVTSVFTFQPMVGLPAGVKATAVAAGSQFHLVLGSDGVVYGTGYNISGQLTGFGTRTTLTPLTGLPAGRRAIAVAAGAQHSVVLDDLGRVYGAGASSKGQITGSIARSTLTEFADMPAGVRMTDISASGNHTVMLGSDSRAYAVGENTDGQIGTGDNSPQLSPARMLRSSGAVDVGAGSGHTLVITAGGGLLATGRGLSGQIGGSSSVNVLRPITASSSETGPSPIAQVDGGGIHTLAVDEDGVIRGTGSNGNGQSTGLVAADAPRLTAMVGQPTVSTVVPKVSGRPGVGVALKVSDGSWWPSPSSLDYQWERGGVVVSTYANYLPVLADAGATLRVRVTASRSSSVPASAFAADVKVPLFVMRKPTITGKLKVKSTLRAVPGTWTPKPTSYTYRWFRNGKLISGATKSTYKLKSADRRRTIRVEVTARRTGAASGVASSPSTKKIK